MIWSMMLQLCCDKGVDAMCCTFPGLQVQSAHLHGRSRPDLSHLHSMLQRTLVILSLMTRPVQSAAAPLISEMDFSSQIGGPSVQKKTSA